MDLGKFINDKAEYGYYLPFKGNQKYLKIFSKPIFEFWLHPKHPLTFEMPDGTKIRPDRHLAETDMGSTPRSLQLFFPSSEFICSYIFHDSAYNHHGLYFKHPNAHQYIFRKMTRKDVDKLCLCRMIRVEGGGPIKQRMIYRMVRMFGGAPWKKGKHPDTLNC